jgi:hypothetical protein
MKLRQQNKMEDYISRRAAIKMIEEDIPEVVYYRKEDAVACLEYLPSANVVLKSDFERLQAERDALIKNYAECMKDYAKEIFDELESYKNILGAIILYPAEHTKLRNKYVEGIMDEVEC